MAIGKVNLLLVGLIGVILMSLVSNEIVSPREPVLAPVRAMVVAAPTPPVAPVAPQALQEDVPVAAENEHRTAPAKAVRTVPAGKKHPPVKEALSEAEATVTPVEAEALVQKDAAKNSMAFNLWSVSELRLRSRFTQLMNNGAVAPAEVEARKKEYLSFVTRRTRKCGELDTRFIGHINTPEKLVFHKGDADMLECHTAENIIELARVNGAVGAGA